jgi:lipoprotein NlpD
LTCLTGMHWSLNHDGFVLVRLLLVLAVSVWLTGCSGGGTVAPVQQLGAAAYGGPHPSYYVVRQGDTLYSIGWRYGVHYHKLARWNGISAPYTIYAGQKLRLRAPPGSENAARRSFSSSRQRVNSRPPTNAAALPTSRGPISNQPHEPPASKASGKAVQGLHWHWPTQGEVIQTFSAADPSRKGVDIAGQVGQPIVAAAEGKVIYSGVGPPRYSKLIIIKHGNDFLSTYAHNQAVMSKEGDWVQRGQKIAEMGLGGASHRAKLHFEIRHNGRPVDPLHYLPAQ